MSNFKISDRFERLTHQHLEWNLFQVQNLFHQSKEQSKQFIWKKNNQQKSSNQHQSSNIQSRILVTQNWNLRLKKPSNKQRITTKKAWKLQRNLIQEKALLSSKSPNKKLNLKDYNSRSKTLNFKVRSQTKNTKSMKKTFRIYKLKSTNYDSNSKKNESRSKMN